MATICYKYDPEKWFLGTPCKHGHLWPGTEQSLRSTYVTPAGERVAKCAGCQCKKTDWLIRFIDNEASGVPAKFQLGALCKKGHAWEGTPYSLRRATDGTCRHCEIERGSNYDPERSHRWYERNKEKHRAAAKERRQQAKQSGEWQEYLDRTREQRKEYKRRYRRKKGTPGREQVQLNAALRAALKRSAPTVAELVLRQQREYWREHQDEYREFIRERARQKHRWRQMADPAYRRYHRNKSKHRKAKMRELHAVRFRRGEIERRFADFNHTCAYCGNSGDLHIEHFIPISKGGPHAIGNIVPACQPCNFSKRNHDPEDWYRQQEFFREQRWRLILRTLGKQPNGVRQLALL